MMSRACPIEAVFQHAAPRLAAVQRDSQQVAVSLEQLIRLLVSDGPALEAALPMLKVQATQVVAAMSVPREVPLLAPEPPPLALPVTESVAEEEATTSEALWLPYAELEGLLRNSPGMVRPLMEALLLQSLASQAAEPSAAPSPARQAA